MLLLHHNCPSFYDILLFHRIHFLLLEYSSYHPLPAVYNRLSYLPCISLSPLSLKHLLYLDYFLYTYLSLPPYSLQMPFRHAMHWYLFVLYLHFYYYLPYNLSSLYLNTMRDKYLYKKKTRFVHLPIQMLCSSCLTIYHNLLRLVDPIYFYIWYYFLLYQNALYWHHLTSLFPSKLFRGYLSFYENRFLFGLYLRFLV